MNDNEKGADPRELLEAMMLARAFELQNRALYKAGNFPQVCASIGQEAAGVGVVKALAARDYILTNHRSATHLLARGADPGRLLAEIMGRSTGYCKGKSGPLHVSAKELGVILTSTIVGGELSLATGVALSLTTNGSAGIAACIFGDGAASEGIFHESVNLAAVWNLPVLYVCENNQWQAYVHRNETMLTDRIATRAAAYGIEGVSVDGNDVEAVYAATRDAAAYVRKHGKPMLLETYTYRTSGHTESDAMAYVHSDELSSWQERDPIELLKRKMLVIGTITRADIAAMTARVERRIEDALTFAQSSPFPALSELTTDVYA
jgi:TPP-dependent pyruvate/acetoin dehydrogenase alpha subunit